MTFDALQPHHGPIRGEHHVRATPENILWGYLPNAAATPVLTIDAGATVTVDTLSHEGLLEDQGRDPIGYFASHGVDRRGVLDDAVDIAGGLFGVLPFAGGTRRVEFPLAPFMGVMGVAPATADKVHSVPPGDHGGNIDVNLLTVGSSLYLPVQVDGALFHVGDPHYAQGDGEVALTAMEASLPGHVPAQASCAATRPAPRPVCSLRRSSRPTRHGFRSGSMRI